MKLIAVSYTHLTRVEVIDINYSNIKEKCTNINAGGSSIIFMAVKYGTYAIAQEMLELLDNSHHISWMSLIHIYYICWHLNR